MKRLFFFFLFIFIVLSGKAQTKYPLIIMETNKGTVKIMLYDSTAFHSENFVKLVNEGYYNGQLFHRVINSFMIQTGDDKSINADSITQLGNGGKEYTIPAEFFPSYFHKKGTVAAARESDDVNPKKESSGSQFYIVKGQVFSRPQIDFFIKTGRLPALSENQINAYTSVGGTPHLDNNYTVFGEVVEGLDVVDSISVVKTNKFDRPVENIIITKMYTIQ